MSKMIENERAIEQMLEQEGHQATQNGKQAIADFTVEFARKLIKKSLFPRKTNITIEDVRNTYEVMNKIHSFEYQQTVKNRLNEQIDYTNKAKFEKTLAQINNTVNFYPNSDCPQLRTTWEFQIAFENSNI